LLNFQPTVRSTSSASMGLIKPHPVPVSELFTIKMHKIMHFNIANLTPPPLRGLQPLAVFVQLALREHYVVQDQGKADIVINLRFTYMYLLTLVTTPRPQVPIPKQTEDHKHISVNVKG